ncbi:MAG: DUF1294 domain-containing protein [Verrucomicrobiota bacterium]
MTRFGWMVLLAVGGAALVLALALGAIGLSALRALFVGVNLATMLCYGYDKLRARAGMERVPELALHLLAVGGGTPGAFAGQLLFRHKTRDVRFRVIFFAIAAVQVVVLLAFTRL